MQPQAKHALAPRSASLSHSAMTRRSHVQSIPFKPLAIALAAAALAWAAPGEARVTRIVIDHTQDLANPFDATKPYQLLGGRAFGELDPLDRHNEQLTDLRLAPRNASGKVEYSTRFVIRKPKDDAAISGVMWHDVPNRGRNVNFPVDSFAAGDVHLLSGWQGDNAANTAVPAGADCLPETVPACTPPALNLNNYYVKTPVLSGVTGRIFGRIINRSGTNQPLNVQNAPIPYFPANSADNSDATLAIHSKETVDGVVTVEGTVPNGEWKFCYGAGATFASPGTPTSLPVRICLDGARRQFDPFKLYQVVYTAKDPYVLGAGTAAFRDVGSFFRYASAAQGNPLAGKIRWQIMRGSSQSGNFTRHYIHLGMNQDEAGRIVHEGAWPLIAGRRVANNSRWGQPDGVLELFQMGSEGPQWWKEWPDRVRDLPTRGILDRCERTHTCPKVVETFGGAEVFALKMTTSWVGTDAKKDIPLPENVRRYYLPSSDHGGGDGTMDENPPDADAAPVGCPGNNFGRGTLRENPVPATQLVNRVRVALREWVMTGKEPPPSQWPTLKPLRHAVENDGHGRGHDDEDEGRGKGHDKWRPLLVEPTMAAMGFPRGVPSIPDSIFLPENFIFPVFDYDWGPQYDHSEANGVPTNAPPPIRSVIKMLVPRVDADGNELGGVPTVLRDAPLGTYLGWNITAGPGDVGFNAASPQPFHRGQVCDYVGGMVPFAKTRAQRLAAGDPRLSLEERYGTHDGYVAAVKKAADNAACKDYLNAGPQAATMGAKCAKPSLPPGVADDWVEVVTRAMASNVCNQPGDGGKCNPAAP